MIPETLSLLLLSAFIFIGSAIVAYISLWQLSVLRKTIKEQQGYDSKRKALLSEQEKTVHGTFVETIDEAQKAAKLLLSQANDFEQRLEKLETQLREDIAQKHLKALAKEREALHQYYVDKLKTISDDIEKHTAMQLDQTQAVLQERIKQIQKALDLKVQDAFQKIEEELAVYKTKRLKAVDEQIYSIVQHVSEELIQKTLPLSTHEKLVKDALEKAKETVPQ